MGLGCDGEHTDAEPPDVNSSYVLQTILYSLLSTPHKVTENGSNRFGSDRFTRLEIYLVTSELQVIESNLIVDKLPDPPPILKPET